ncbi:hypothetical protein [Brachybacterium saurashtrense]|uniref:Glycoside hydrolase family 65 n=1 Tax=Brachybacterium saurashtrense TaxID=556288 RepID=A0A345YR03_9MICO|nr:hypothetical protein [Brachybacterium saurashtrense]AXK46355.1 hypothetical protein DWV08_12535 [Brachybacterium saurashtrense]RRR24095.1 hypothetical protein DXU92_04285 [Brachybacterium saurashtrense]
MTPAAIDRRAVVSRHDPHLDGTSEAVLSVGNGSFAAGVDRTGTQTLCGPGHPETRLNTMAEWGWHSMPEGPPAPWESVLHPYATSRGRALFVDLPEGTEAPGPGPAWFRENPHKVSLLRFFLVDARTGRAPAAADLAGATQHLALYDGLIRSRFRYRGRECTVVTAADPEHAALALRMDAPGLALALAFPYGTTDWERAADWERPGAHETVLAGDRIRRRLDDLAYDVQVHGGGLRRTGAHEVQVLPPGDAAEAPLDLVLALLPREVPPLSLPAASSLPTASPSTTTSPGTADAPPPSDPAALRDRAAAFWSAHWEGTGVLDLGAADDPRAAELERRVVLSRHLQRVHAAGVLPPAETGLLANSWRGRFHLEMHWWHAAHFALWGDAPSLRRSLDFYAAALPTARATAARQHCRGARWPKQTGPDLHESPSDIGPFLLWQQPHPLHLAELLRRADPAAGRDPMLQEIVEETALCLVDLLDEDGDRLGLGAPLVGAQERHVQDRAVLRDPSFELAYTAWALRIADGWRHRRGAAGAGELTAIARRIHAPLTAQGRLSTFRAGPAMDRSDHPSHLLAYGMVPPTGTIPARAAQHALEDALQDWDWDSTWGWDYPALAMTAARLQRPETAVDALLLPTVKNRADEAGHVPQRPGLPAYLPANGGTLIAAALMAAGWDGGPDSPGLPPQWGARHEGILPLPG